MHEKVFSHSNIVHAIDPDIPTETMCGLNSVPLGSVPFSGYDIYSGENYREPLACAFCEAYLTPKELRQQIMQAECDAQTWEDIIYCLNNVGPFSGDIPWSALGAYSLQSSTNVTYEKSDLDLVRQFHRVTCYHLNGLRQKARELLAEI